MPTILVYEYCCATGLGRDSSDPAHSLFREGRAMRDAVVEDLQALPDVNVLILDDETVFDDRLAVSDEVVVIAPELDGLMWNRCRDVIQCGKQLLGCSLDAIQLTSDKWALARHWQQAGIPTPETWLFGEEPNSLQPCVVKPRFGAGSTETFLRTSESASIESTLPAIVQPYIPGIAASVAFLVGPNQILPLLPTLQQLSADGRFTYLGGTIPIPPSLAKRAVTLGIRAVTAVPGLAGYVGVDLVLGAPEDGSADVAIEINPRFTTSFVGLRRLAGFNLLDAMRKLICGEPLHPPHWKDEGIHFFPNGRIHSLHSDCSSR